MQTIELKAKELALFDILNDFINNSKIEWKNYKVNKLFIKQKSPLSIMENLYDSQKLASKEMFSILNIVMKTVKTEVNYIKMGPLKSRIFSTLCKYMGVVHSKKIDEKLDILT